MKHLITLCASAILGALVLFSTPSAHAAVVSCTARTGTTGAWPDSVSTTYMGTPITVNYIYYCNGSTADASLIHTALLDVVSADVVNNGFDSLKAGNVLKAAPSIHNIPSIGAVSANGAQFWIFANSTDFNDTCAARPNDFGLASATDCPVATATDFGFTIHNTTTGAGQLTALFKAQIAAWTTQGKTVGNTVTHEVGHWLDSSSQYQGLLGTGGTTQFTSDGSNFTQNLSPDWTAFIALVQQCANPSNVFTGQKDSTLNPICTGGSVTTPKYSGNNQSVLKTAWPYYFDPSASTPSTNAEFFAQSFSHLVTGSWAGASSPDKYFPSFACTQKLIDSISRYGVVPGRRLQVLSGTATVGDQIYFQFNNGGVIHNTPTYTVNSTVLSNVATALAGLINNDMVLQGQGVSATVDGQVVAVVNNGQTITPQRTGIPGHAPTETILQQFLDWPSTSCHKF